MSITEKDILQGMKDLRLSEKERTLMRSELSAYSDLHAMPSIEASPFNSLAFLGNIFAHSRVLMAGTLAFVLVITGGSATASAAEKAVPGEPLYGVKILVNEPVAAVFAGAGLGKARYHAKLAVRRVEEAEVLEARGALTSERAAQLAERFVEEAERAEAEATRLESGGDVSASIAIRTELATDLSAHVDASTEDSDAVQAVSAAAAPALMKATAGTEIARDEIVVSEKEAFHALIASKVARLREYHTAPRAFAVEDDGYDEEEIADGSDSIAQGEHKTASRSLLSGSSVASVTSNASTTASSSPKERTRLLKALLRVNQESSEGATDVDGEDEDGNDDHLIEPASLIGPVENPARLVPRSAIPGG